MVNDISDENWYDYVEIRNEYNKIIKAKKNEMTRKQIKNAGSNQKQMWKCLNNLVSCKNKKQSDEAF